MFRDGVSPGCGYYRTGQGRSLLHPLCHLLNKPISNNPMIIYRRSMARLLAGKTISESMAVNLPLPLGSSEK